MPRSAPSRSARAAVVSVKTTAATRAEAEGKGQAVGNGSSDGVGVGVSINLVDITNTATVGAATITGTGLAVEALMADKNDGRIRAWNDTDKTWVLIDRGTSLPLSPDDGRLLPADRGRRPRPRSSTARTRNVTSPTELQGEVDGGLRAERDVHRRRRHRHVHVHRRERREQVHGARAAAPGRRTKAAS
jgi:hypothetical protein